MKNTDPAFCSNRLGECIRVSPEICEETGWSRQDFLGMGWQDKIHPEDLRTEEYIAAVRAGRPWMNTYRMRYRCGRWQRMNSVAVPIYGDSREYLGMLGYTLRAS